MKSDEQPFKPGQAVRVDATVGNLPSMNGAVWIIFAKPGSDERIATTVDASAVHLAPGDGQKRYGWHHTAFMNWWNAVGWKLVDGKTELKDLLDPMEQAWMEAVKLDRDKHPLLPDEPEPPVSLGQGVWVSAPGEGERERQQPSCRECSDSGWVPPMDDDGFYGPCGCPAGNQYRKYYYNLSGFDRQTVGARSTPPDLTELSRERQPQLGTCDTPTHRGRPWLHIEQQDDCLNFRPLPRDEQPLSPAPAPERPFQVGDRVWIEDAFEDETGARHDSEATVTEISADGQLSLSFTDRKVDDFLKGCTWEPDQVELLNAAAPAPEGGDAGPPSCHLCAAGLLPIRIEMGVWRHQESSLCPISATHEAKFGIQPSASAAPGRDAGSDDAVTPEWLARFRRIVIGINESRWRNVAVADLTRLADAVEAQARQNAAWEAEVMGLQRMDNESQERLRSQARRLEAATGLLRGLTACVIDRDDLELVDVRDRAAAFLAGDAPHDDDQRREP